MNAVTNKFHSSVVSFGAKYIKSPFFFCFTVFSSLGLMQALFARNTAESLKFIGFAIAVAALHFFFYRNEKPVRESLKSLCLFLIPPLLVVLTAASELPKEASSQEYQRIGTALKYPKNEQALVQIEKLISEALDDGKISKWESAELEGQIFNINGFLSGSDASMTQAGARSQLLALMNWRRLNPGEIKYFGKSEHGSPAN